MAAGMGTLRLAPDEFWCTTPRELAAALGLSRRADAAPRRGDLERLMQLFPDR